MTLPIISHPTFELEIPSTKKKVKMRPFLVKEEKILLTAKASSEYGDILAAVKQVVNNCFLDNVDINRLTIFDLEYLYVRLRGMSVSNVVKASYKDGEDDKIYDFDIDLNNLSVKWPDKIDKTIKINEEYSLLMKYPEASLYSDKEFLSKGDENLDILVLKTIDKIVKGDQMIEPGMEGRAGIKEFIDTLPIKAYNDIQEFWANMPTLYYEINYKNSLGNDRRITLKSLQDFFLFV